MKAWSRTRERYWIVLGLMFVLAAPSPSLGSDVDPIATSLASFALPEPRSGHAAARLDDGVLITGGSGSDDRPLADAIRWDHESSAFEEAGTLSTPRLGATATQLPGGAVLVIGGIGEDRGTVAPIEVWDPQTRAFSPAGTLEDPRVGHTSTLLADGRILVVGGTSVTDDGGGLLVYDSVEIWDPSTATVRSSGSMSAARYGHSATLLDDGRVLVAGGIAFGTDGLSHLVELEVWDPGTDRFATIGSLSRGLVNHTATAVRDGTVHLIGGTFDDGGALSSEVLEIHPSTGEARHVGDLTTSRSRHTASLLPDGTILIVGGDDGSGAVAGLERWDPIRQQALAAGALGTGRSDHTATTLPDGRVLVVGGYSNGRFLDSVEIWSSREVAADGPWDAMGTVDIAPANDLEGARPEPADALQRPGTGDSIAAAVRSGSSVTDAVATRVPRVVAEHPVGIESFTAQAWAALDVRSGSPKHQRVARAIEDLAAKAGVTVDDIAFATGLIEPRPGNHATVTAVGINGSEAEKLAPDIVRLMMSDILEPALKSMTISGRFVLRVTDAATPGTYPRYVHVADDTIWIVDAGTDLRGAIFAALP